ncbi:MAG TPA: ADP-ribosylglycohydrolase family protein [Planctomycetota bacterium]|nr:ADP-ribosylglycohydrolase family protein [Planctomycetota bacterium]
MIEKFEGCLLGLAVGDALGAPLEFQTRDQIQIRHATVTEMIGGGLLDLRPGETTDDTAMALALAESLVAKKGFDPADAMARYLAWYRTGPKDIGSTIRAALRHVDDGGDWKEAAVRAAEIVRGETAGNGTMVRCVPLALLRHRDPNAVIRDGAAEARLTHVDPRAGAGSAAVGVCVALALVETDRKKLLDRAFEVLENNPDGTPNLLPDVTAKREGELRPEPFVVDTLEVALWHFLRAKNFEECLVRVVNAGGDADTIGAIAGAIGGAFWGIGAIPVRWLRTIQERTTIKALARDLHALATG